MRLLVVGHSYVTAFAQAKYVAMKDLDPDLQIRIVTPPYSNHVFMRHKLELAVGLGTEDVRAIGAIQVGSHMTYIIDPWALGSLLKGYKPDHVHIEEDPHSFAGVETVALTRLYCPASTISFFIWDNLARTPRFPLSAAKWLLTHWSLAQASLVVCGNSESAGLLRSRKGFQGPSVVLPQVGLNPADYRPISSSENSTALLGDPGDVWVGFIGRLVPEKGVGILLEALKGLLHLPWKLLVVGNGPMKVELLSYWKQVLGSRLVHIDAVPHALVPGHLKRLNVFVLASYSTNSWKEQFGLTLAQAMMTGLACIGTDSGAIPEVLGGSGVVVPERDVTSLRFHLERLLSSHAERRRLGEAARTQALSRFSNTSVAERYLSEFNALRD